MTHIKKSGGKPPEEWFYPSSNFGALPPELCSEESSRIVVLPVPYEGTTTYGGGCRRGPAAIIEASANMELYDDELRREPCEVGIYTSTPLAVVDDAEEMIRRVDSVASAYLRKGKFVTMLGGEHSITFGMVRALKRVYSDLSVLVIDAHADFRESYHDNKFNHACVSRRIAEICPLAQAGIRSLSVEEVTALEKEKVTTVWASDFRKSRNGKGIGALVRRLLGGLTDHVYVSIDVDAFDPSIMPAVGTPEPGGLFWDEVLNIVRSVVEEKKVAGLDLVELAPVPGLIHPEFTCARLLYKAWGYAFRDA